MSADSNKYIAGRYEYSFPLTISRMVGLFFHRKYAEQFNVSYNAFLDTLYTIGSGSNLMCERSRAKSNRIRHDFGFGFGSAKQIISDPNNSETGSRREVPKCGIPILKVCIRSSAICLDRPFVIHCRSADCRATYLWKIADCWKKYNCKYADL